MDTYRELEELTQRIEDNTATLRDYQRYESLLLHAGVPREYIYSYLTRAGFDSWEAFVEARQSKMWNEIGGTVVGGLIGLGLGLLVYNALSESK